MVERNEEGRICPFLSLYFRKNPTFVTAASTACCQYVYEQKDMIYIYIK
jgi:hypothetical protein